jgi:hypothetical protein
MTIVGKEKAEKRRRKREGGKEKVGKKKGSR